MLNKNDTHKLNGFLSSNNTIIILVMLLVIFLSYAIFIAFNLQPGIIPDEPAHFTFSKHYSSTWGIPPDVPETYQLGWYINQNPFLYYWINGRVINLIELVHPSVTELQLLVSLRLINVFFGLGTVLFCFFLSKELIKHKWWQLLPVFLLTNTLMFVILAGGVNYDNLAILFSLASLYFLVRVFNKRAFLGNSLGWMINILAGTLVKYTILPLALAMFIAWIVFISKNINTIFPLQITKKVEVALGIIFIGLVLGNLAIYGYNLVAYQGITPKCIDILTEDQCSINPYINRFEEIALDDKLTIAESIELGYPDPLTYIIASWIPNMFYRIFGILGHQSYFPTFTITLFRLLFYMIFALIIKYWRKPSFRIVSLVSIFIFYALVLLYINFNSELVYGFKQIAMQGRYIFPVIGIAYVLCAKFLENIPNNAIRLISLGATLVIFFMGGPIKLILYYETFFSTFFIR